MTTNSDLIGQAQELARRLTYNDDKEAPVKHTLHELCHRLGAATLRVTSKKGKLMVATTMGQSRPMTFSERVLYRLFNVIPPIGGWPEKK